MGVRVLPVAIVFSVSALAADRVDFNRDVRPILSDKCFTCHGPDSANRMTKLRFDTEAGARVPLSGGRSAIVAGDPERSELIRRITAEHKGLRMPPVASGRSVSARETEILREWIRQGAQWQGHWSFIAPQRPALPPISDAAWPRTPVDHFVLSRLDREGLRPSPEASKQALIRRVSLDLTGLPPSPAEVDAFLRDDSPRAYEKVVDRLLASPRYGERMAIRWLDAARYADTNGYQTDAERFMWRWRDWVIDAFNRNLPFDRFTVEQIAGDMLPNPTLEQRIATGFNRNHRGNGEGGIIPEEYAVEYVADRVETTATVWLGLTLGCARCHDHKYDPLTQKEFYRVFAYFNNVPEKGKANKYGNSDPLIPAPTPDQEARLTELDREMAAAGKHFNDVRPRIEPAQRAWEASLKPGEADWVSGYQRVKLPEIAGAHFDGKRDVDAGDIARFGFYDRFTLAARIVPRVRSAAIVTRAEDETEGSGYGLYLKDGRVQLNLVQRWLDDALRVETEAELQPGTPYHIAATYDGSRVADGVRIYINGREQKLRVLLDELNQSFAVKQPLRIAAGGGFPRFQGDLGGLTIYTRVLTPDEMAVLATAEDIASIAGIPPNRRTQPQAAKIAEAFLDMGAPAELRSAWTEMRAARARRQAFIDSVPTVMVMKERETPRDTFLLIRGAYDRPGEKLSPGTPSVLPSLPAAAPNNRLGFARWLVHADNPLTARVGVNRFWQMYFGNGLVRTVEDFGSQGEWPSHPELLDWLATEFVRTGWDIKALQKLIVMSAAYRQSSRVTPELLARDPENRLLARAPRLRLPAEMVRDQALFASGLLVEKIGGPSVKPYQPAGLWKELSGGEDYKQDSGDKLYRRSLYTFWKRASPPPSMMNFDAAGRETCVVRQSRTNTPLQALDLMNDVTFVEAARVLAERSLKETAGGPADRIAYSFRRVLSRPPRAEEAALLRSAYQRYLDLYQTQPEAARKLLSQGERPYDAVLDARELAAHSMVASLILNLDEAVMRP